MQFSLRTLLVFFIFVASALGAGGVWALVGAMYLLCLVISIRVARRKSPAAGCLVVILIGFPVLVGLMLPLYSRAGPAAYRAQCANRMKQLGIALHNYEADYHCFPPAYIRDKEGRPMHSWRVLILPYLEEGTLYKKFRLNEPWDSSYNKTVAANMPSCFQCGANRNAAPGMTDYMAVTGPGTMWDGDRGCKIKDITDGTDQTLMLIEAAGASVPWNAPQDLTLKEIMDAGLQGKKGLMSYHDPKATDTARPLGNVLYADGHTDCLYGRFTPEDFKKLATIAGGESADNLEVVLAAPPPMVLSFEARMIGLAILLASFLYLVSRPLPEVWVRRGTGD
ncbi:MAG: DUF1559 domain-containing protein [Pirellulales bacterium]|nr:DUF1559 domain-containing protein [Pirellulales bacterium]